jgi:hypothetical protein
LAFYQRTASALGIPEGNRNPGNVDFHVRPVPTAQDDNGNTPIPQIQLVLETLICGQQNVETFCFGGVQQFPVCEAMPRTFSDRLDGVVP